MTSIAQYAFSNCTNLASITIPNSVTSIGVHAFENCSNLKSINIPSNVTSIGDYTFDGCSSLTSITIPNGVTYISNYVFRNCSGLTSITIPNSVTSIYKYAFYGCTSLSSITIPGSVTSIGNNAFQYCSSLTSLNIQTGLKSIGNNAFLCSGLTSIIIPSSVTSIGQHAFRGCSNLTSITIPSSVTLINDYVFQDCSSLASITIPNTVTLIGDVAFSNCSSLTSVTIPNSVKTIGYSAFQNCSSLTSITIPSSVKSIGNHAFENCSGLTSISIPESVTYIGNTTFMNCRGLTTFTIPSNVTTISDNAFDGCSGLTSITIPGSVTNIGNSAFRNCNSLTSVTVENETPITIGVSVFPDRANQILYVPAGSKAAYEAADYWKEFKEIREIGNSEVTKSFVTYTGSDYSYTIPWLVKVGAALYNNPAYYETITIPLSDLGDITYNDFISKWDIERTMGTSGSCKQYAVSYPADSDEPVFTALSSGSGLGVVVEIVSIEPTDKMILRWMLTSAEAKAAFIDASPRPTSCTTAVRFKRIDGDESKDIYVILNTGTITITEAPPTTGTVNLSSRKQAEYWYAKNSSVSGSGQTEIHASVPGVEDELMSIGETLDVLVSECFEDGQIVDLSNYNDMSAFITLENGNGYTGKDLTYDLQFVQGERRSFKGISSDGKIYNYVTRIADNGKSLQAFIDRNGNGALDAGEQCQVVAKLVYTDSYSQDINHIAVQYQNTDFAKALLNRSAIILSDDALTAYVAVKAKLGTANIELKNNVFNVRFLRPVNASGSNVTVDGLAAGSSLTINLLDLVTLTDWRDEPFKAGYWYYYGITDIQIVGDVDADMELTYSPTSVTPVMNAVPAADAYGTITFKNTGTLTESVTTVPVTLKVKHLWGEVYATAYIRVTPASRIINFADAEAKRICVTYWDTDNDGELSEAEAAAATTIGNVFQQSSMTSFNELRYFTGLTSIGGMAFAQCQQLTSLVIPRNVKTVGGGLFYYCDALTSVTVDDENVYLDSRNGCNAIIETATSILLDGCKTTVIPSGVTAIGDLAFYHVHGITSLPIPGSVTAIGLGGLFGMLDLTSLTIPKSVVSLGWEVIGNTNSLQTLVVEQGNPVFDSRNNCNAIIETATNTLVAASNTTVIPESVTSIGYCAYDSYPITSISIPANVASIDEYAIRLCSSLASITVASANKTYDSRGGCNAIMVTATDELLFGSKNTVIPETTRSIGKYAFEGYEDLLEVELPKQVTAIGTHSFADCINLTKVTVHMQQPPAIAESTFTNRANADLYVPAGTLSAYKAADYWKEFRNMIELPDDTPVTGNNSMAMTNLSGYCGKQVVLPIALQNEDEISGMQFLLTLPSGVTIAKNEKNKLMLAKTERCEDHTLSCSDKGGGKYQVLLYSSDVEAFSGNEGVVLNITLDVPADMADGDYNILLSDIELSTPDEQERTCADVVATLTVKSYMPGDANGDGKINVVDITATANYILGSPGSSFIFDAADVNHDGKVNVVDIVAIANIILYGGTPSSSRPADWQWDNNDYLVLSGHGDTFGISLNNLQTYCAFQMDVRIPEGAVLSEVRLNAGRSAGHTLSYSKLSDGLYRVLVYSADNAAIGGNNGQLLSVCGTGFDMSDVSLCNICFTDAQQQCAALRWIKTDTDGVSTVAGEENSGETVYNLHGQKVQKTRKGLYIINNKKTIIR